MGAPVRTVIEGRRFLHKELWRVVKRQLEHGKSVPAGGFYDDLVSMVFALHAFEAYLNYVGEHLAPDIWQDERNYFRKEPFRGFDGKVRKVLELAQIAEPTRDLRPYSSVWLLKSLRDQISHAKPEDFAHAIEHDSDTVLPFHHTPLDEIVTRANAEQAHIDIETFAQVIHTAAKTNVDDIWFGLVPFGGPLQYSGGSTTLAT